MRKTAISAVHVGILTSAALLLMAFGIIVIGHGARYLTGSRIFEVHFSRINGLQPDAPVRLHGFDVGAVQSIDFSPDPRLNYMIVKVWIQREAARRLRANSLAQIETMGLLGDKYINISIGSPASPMIAPGQILRSEDPVDYDAVLRSLRGSGDVMTNVLAVAVPIRDMSEAIQKGNGLLHDLIYGQSSRIGRTVTGRSLREAIDTATGAAKQIQQTFEKLNRGNGVAATLLSEKHVNHRIVPDLAASISNLRRASERSMKRADVMLMPMEPFRS